MRRGLFLAAIGFGCGESPGDPPSAPVPSSTPSGAPAANVAGVTVEGEPNAYTFFVSVRSDETGCDRYADWWEVTDPGGNLLYRRILDHSHPDEQPFTRDGGPVPILPDDVVIVRAHLHDAAGGGGYGAAMQGTVGGGFASLDLAGDFAASLASVEPLPTECLF